MVQLFKIWSDGPVNWKQALIVAAIPNILGWVVIAVAQTSSQDGHD